MAAGMALLLGAPVSNAQTADQPAAPPAPLPRLPASESVAAGPAPGQWSCSLRLADAERDVIEFDDQFSTAGTEGAAAVRKLTVEAAVQALPTVELALRLGLGALDIEDAPDYPFSFDNGFLWGIGVQARLAEWPESKLSLYADFDLDFCSSSGEVAVRNMTFDTDWLDWRLALTVERCWSRLVCRAGLEYSDLEIVYTHPYRLGGTREGGFEASDNFGLCAEIEYGLPTGLSGSVSLRLVDATEFGVGLRYEF
jgi:hypothetical protein